MTDLELFQHDKDKTPLFPEEYYKETVFENIAGSKIELKEKEFYNCTFKNVMLNFSKFYDCRFEACSFTGCDFSLSKFLICSFIDVKFADCKLVGIDWTNISKPYRASFNKCKMNDSIFFNMDLRGGNITLCESHNVDFENTNLSKAVLHSTDFMNSKFNGANLTQADFSGAFNYLINPTVCNIKKAKFSMPEAISLLSHLQIIIE